MSHKVADAYAVAVRADLPGVRQLLASLGRNERVPRLLLEAVLAQFEGQTPRAIELFQRAFKNAKNGERLYIADLVGALLAARTSQDAYEEMMAGLEPAERERPLMRAMQAGSAAMHHDLEASRTAGLAARERLDDCPPLERARTLHRLAHAAYYRGDFAEAVESANESAAIFERLCIYRSATAAYSIVYSVNYSATGDFKEALRIAGRMTELARCSNDASYEMASLVAEYELAAEMAEDSRFYQLQKLIRGRALPEQYAERFARGIADALAYGWAGEFEALRANADILRDQVASTRKERALCYALRALAEAALDERDEATRASRRAIAISSLPASAEFAYQTRYKRLARGLAAATCILIGDTVRGRRALATRGLRDTNEVRSLLAVAEGGRWQDVYPSVRGYARIVALVRERLQSRRHPSALTKSEISVLTLLAEGLNAPQIARATGRSVHTIHAHTRGIIAKMGVSGRAAAINQARKNGLIP